MGSIKRGAFARQANSTLTRNTTLIHDEDLDLDINIVFICKCGVVTTKFNDEFFGCVHCDSVCLLGNCDRCKTLEEWEEDADL